MHENGKVFGRFFAEFRPTCARILAQPRVGGLPAPGLVGLGLDLAGRGARMEVARGEMR